MRSFVAAAAAFVLSQTAPLASECPNNPNALGTARTIVVRASEHSRIGTMQYGETLPLGEKDVVLTFDDGPLPPYSDRVLEILAAECARATFFVVGRQARAFPEKVRRIHDHGHTIATHSQTHPRYFSDLPMQRRIEEVDEGIASAAAALGDRAAVAPFFRVPGLRSSAETESALAERGLMVWSADFLADDWRHISANNVLERALDRLERKGKGVLLLHDIQPATVLALPELLKQLKARGYRIVHVMPAGSDRARTLAKPEQRSPRAPAKTWPRILEAAARPDLPVPSPQSFGWPHLFRAKPLVATASVSMRLLHRPGYQVVRIVPIPRWPISATPAATAPAAGMLAAPSRQSFGIPHPFGPKITLPTSGAETLDLSSGPNARISPLPVRRSGEPLSRGA